MPAASPRRSDRRRRKRRKLGFLQKFISVVAAAFAIVLGMTVFFKVSEIQVVGQDRYSDLEIIEASGISEGDNLLTISRAKSSSYIRLLLPYVRDAQISRSLPGTVIISVEECEAVAVILSDYGDWWKIDSAARALERVSEDDTEGLIRIDGPKILAPLAGDEIVVAESYGDCVSVLAGLLQSLEQYGINDKIVSIDMENSYDIVMQYESRFSVLLGDASDVDYRIRYMMTVVEKLVSNETGTIDLTFEQEKIAYFRPE